MANYDTVNDLKADALFRAGEPIDGSSDYEAAVVTYLNAVQQGLLLGSPFGLDRPGLPTLPIIDWWWARAIALLQTEAAIQAGTVALTQGVATATFSVAPAVSVAGWHLQVGTRPVVPEIIAHTAASPTATLDAPWPDGTVTAEPFVLAKLQVTLPTDWLRSVGPGRVVVSEPPGVGWLQIVDWSTLEAVAPRSRLLEGLPDLAALLDPQTLEVRRWTTGPVRLEVPYLQLPADLSLGGTPRVPRHHRRLLAVGASVLILLDKADDKVAALLGEFKALHGAMVQEHTHHLRRLSARFGQIVTRPAQDRATRLMTASGIVL